MEIITNSAPSRMPDAATIAAGLDKARQVGPGRWTACCPAHLDENPSLSLTDRNGRTLLFCHSGCSQEAVLHALRARGLWPEAKLPRPEKATTLYSETEMRASVSAHENNLKRGIPTATRDQRRYRQFVRVLCRPFTPEEVVEANMFALVYQAAVRRGETPTPDEDRHFMICNKVHDAMQGYVPYEW